MFLVFHPWEDLQEDKCCCLWGVQTQVTVPPGGQGCSAEGSTLPYCASHSGAGLHDPAQTSWSWSPPSATSSPWDRCPSNAWWSWRGCTAVATTNKQPAFACLKFAIRASLCSVGNTVCDSSEAVFQQSCKQNFVRATNTNIRIFFTHGKAFLFVSRWKFQ